MNKSKLIIFCQAPADLPYTLDLYEKYKESHSIYLFVINVKGMYRFLSYLNLKIEKLAFIPYSLTNLKKIQQFVSEKNRINNLWKEHFSEINYAEVYFFSRFEDWLTSAFIKRLSQNNTIIINYINHYDNSSSLFQKKEKVTFKLKIYLFMLKVLTGVNFKAIIKQKLPEFPVEEYIIKELQIDINPDILIKYQYKFDFCENEKPNLLFFISPCENTIFNSTYYNDKLIAIILLFRDTGFNVIIKGHPRLGTPKLISEIIDFEIPDYVPGEFLSIKTINLCIGLSTTTICYYSKNTALPTYSIIKLFPYSNKELFDVAIEYLDQQSKGKMKFCNDFKELKQIALKIKESHNENK